MKQELTTHLPEFIDANWRIGIVASSYYKEEIDLLLSGAHAVFMEAGLHEESVRVIEVPGSFEIPLIGDALVVANQVDALIGFGIIVEGETHHARLLADQVAEGIMRVQLNYDIPFAFEVLYVHSIEQVRQRAVGPSNKGAEAAYAVLHSLSILKAIREEKS